MTNCGVPPRNRSQQIIAVCVVKISLSIVSVSVRFAYRLYASLEIGLDDWFILATLAAGLGGSLTAWLGTTANGLGRDVWTLTPKEITNMLMFFWIQIPCYFLGTGFVKMSIICFYLRIFPGQGVQRLLWGTFIFVGLWTFAHLIANFFQCTPVSYFWKQWDKDHAKGFCVSTNALAWAHASTNIALDLWILAIPLYQLRKLQLHWKRKIGVAFMFSLGAL